MSEELISLATSSFPEHEGPNLWQVTSALQISVVLIKRRYCTVQIFVFRCPIPAVSTSCFSTTEELLFQLGIWLGLCGWGLKNNNFSYFHKLLIWWKSTHKKMNVDFGKVDYTSTLERYIQTRLCLSPGQTGRVQTWCNWGGGPVSTDLVLTWGVGSTQVDSERRPLTPNSKSLVIYQRRVLKPSIHVSFCTFRVHTCTFFVVSSIWLTEVFSSRSTSCINGPLELEGKGPRPGSAER